MQPGVPPPINYDHQPPAPPVLGPLPRMRGQPTAMVYSNRNPWRGPGQYHTRAQGNWQRPPVAANHGRGGGHGGRGTWAVPQSQGVQRRWAQHPVQPPRQAPTWPHPESPRPAPSLCRPSPATAAATNPPAKRQRLDSASAYVVSPTHQAAAAPELPQPPLSPPPSFGVLWDRIERLELENQRLRTALARALGDQPRPQSQPITDGPASPPAGFRPISNSPTSPPAPGIPPRGFQPPASPPPAPQATTSVPPVDGFESLGTDTTSNTSEG